MNRLPVGKTVSFLLLSTWVSCALVVCTLLACGGRLPPPKRAQAVMTHYFAHYGKQYKETSFGKSRVGEVDVQEIEEIHKRLVQVTAFVILEDNTVYKIRFTMQKKAFGWRAVSWENIGS